jgi:uncharacterized protein YwgA
MDMAQYQWVAAVIAAHPNRTLRGRTRLQKTIKLLQERGLQCNYDFSMHYYGPYSEGLRADVDMLGSLGLVREEFQTLEGGKRRSEFVADDSVEISRIAMLQRRIDVLAEEPDTTILELAATYDAFCGIGLSESNALNATRRKKPRKCNPVSEQKMLKLLKKLDSEN